MSEELRERWAAVCAAFPWEDCARIFAERGWVYGTNLCGDVERKPSAEDLRACADSCFEACARNEEARARGERVFGNPNAVSTGRFIVAVEDGQPEIISQAIHPEVYLQRGLALGFSYWTEE